jgi:iron(III) transport system substrate-binding protein
MKDHASSFGAAIWAAIVVVGWTYVASAATIDELIAAAKREGTLNLHAPSFSRPEGAQELSAAFNKKYGLNIRVNYIPSNNFTADTARVVSQAAIGVPPEWDMMLVTDNHHATLWRRKLHLLFDYQLLGVLPKAIEHDNGSVAISHAITLPAYNRKILSPKDVPNSWEDLLNAKWQDGKLGVSSATHHLARLATGPWGQKKTTEFVKDLARQRPFLGRLAELSTRLQLGEILVATTLTVAFVDTARKAGAPVVFADRIEPVIMLGYNGGVLKGAAHPNAGHLFVGFMATPEGQQIWEKNSGQGSAFVPGTATYEFAKGKELLLMRPEDAELIDRLAADYTKILGFK